MLIFVNARRCSYLRCCDHFIAYVIYELHNHYTHTKCVLLMISTSFYCICIWIKYVAIQRHSSLSQHREFPISSSFHLSFFRFVWVLYALKLQRCWICDRMCVVMFLFFRNSEILMWLVNNKLFTLWKSCIIIIGTISTQIGLMMKLMQ